MMMHAMNEEEPLQDAGATTAGEEATTEESADKAETQEAPEADAAAAGEEEAWRDKYLRLYAEFDNFRKRTMRERADLVRSAGRDLTEAMLPVLDDFERAAAPQCGARVDHRAECAHLLARARAAEPTGPPAWAIE